MKLFCSWFHVFSRIRFFLKFFIWKSIIFSIFLLYCPYFTHFTYFTLLGPTIWRNFSVLHYLKIFRNSFSGICKGELSIKTFHSIELTSWGLNHFTNNLHTFPHDMKFIPLLGKYFAKTSYKLQFRRCFNEIFITKLHHMHEIFEMRVKNHFLTLCPLISRNFCWRRTYASSLVWYRLDSYRYRPIYSFAQIYWS